MGTFGTAIFFLLLFALSLAIYFLPCIIADKRGHPNIMAIFALNLLLGWTFVGWVVALVWASTAFAKPQLVSPRPHVHEAFEEINQDDVRNCPFCAETIKAAAIKCRFCGSNLPPVSISS